MANQIDHPRNFGPAMRALNPAQQRFVIAMLELGSTNYSRAALVAGYKPGDGLRVTAHRLAHDEKVLRALQEESRRRLQASAPMAVSELVKMAEGGTLDEKLKLKAIEMILNRTGFHALSEHRVDVQHSYSDPDAIARIQALSKQLGLDPVKLLGTAGVKTDDKGQVIDAEFEEVDPYTDETPGGEFDFIPDGVA